MDVSIDFSENNDGLRTDQGLDFRVPGDRYSAGAVDLTLDVASDRPLPGQLQGSVDRDILGDLSGLLRCWRCRYGRSSSDSFG